MHLHDLQTTIKQRDPRPQASEQTFYKLMEEVGELAKAIRTRQRHQAGEATRKGSIDEELSDALYALLALANLYDVDIEQAITLKEQLTQLRPPEAVSILPVEVIPVEQPNAQYETRTTHPETPMTQPTRLDPKSIARRFIDELWNGRQLQIADEIIAADCVTHQLRSGSEPVDAPRGPDAVRKQIGDWTTGFPDIRYEVRHMLAEDERVVSQCVLRGTHQGVWLGIQPTGKSISIEMTLTQRIADGKIAEDWVLADFFGVFQQLGLVASLQELLASRR